MKGWHREPYRHSLAARGVRTTSPSLLKHPEVVILDVDEFERKLDEYIAVIDGRNEIEGGRKSVEQLHRYMTDIGIEIDIEGMVDFFKEGNKMFNVTSYEIIGSRAGGSSRSDSDLDVLIHLEFTDAAADFFKPDQWNWDAFFEKLNEDMVNYNFYVSASDGEDRLIDVLYQWSYPDNEIGYAPIPHDKATKNYIRDMVGEIRRRLEYKNIHPQSIEVDKEWIGKYNKGEYIPIDAITVVVTRKNGDPGVEHIKARKFLEEMRWID